MSASLLDKLGWSPEVFADYRPAMTTTESRGLPSFRGEGSRMDHASAVQECSMPKTKPGPRDTAAAPTAPLVDADPPPVVPADQLGDDDGETQPPPVGLADVASARRLAALMFARSVTFSAGDTFRSNHVAAAVFGERSGSEPYFGLVFADAAAAERIWFTNRGVRTLQLLFGTIRNYARPRRNDSGWFATRTVTSDGDDRLTVRVEVDGLRHDGTVACVHPEVRRFIDDEAAFQWMEETTERLARAASEEAEPSRRYRREAREAADQERAEREERQRKLMEDLARSKSAAVSGVTT